MSPLPEHEPQRRWDSTSKSLHWGIALALLIVVPAGYVMSSTYGPSFRDEQVRALHFLASQIHHTLGVLLLAAGLWWILRRVRRGRPAPDPAAPRRERILAAAVHGCLWLLLIIVPWSGWTAISALADSPIYGVTHRWFFTVDGVLPRIWVGLPFDDPAGYARFARIHIWALWAGLGLLALHMASALWHHWGRRDQVLRRFWPLGDQ